MAIGDPSSGAALYIQGKQQQNALGQARMDRLGNSAAGAVQQGANLYEKKQHEDTARKWLAANGGDPSVVDLGHQATVAELKRVKDMQTAKASFGAAGLGDKYQPGASLDVISPMLQGQRQQAEFGHDTSMQGLRDAGDVALQQTPTAGEQFTQDTAERDRGIFQEAQSEPVSEGQFTGILGTLPPGQAPIPLTREPSPMEVFQRGVKGGASTKALSEYGLGVDRLTDPAKTAPVDPYTRRMETNRADRDSAEPKGDDQLIPPEIANIAEKKAGLPPGTLAGKTYRAASLLNSNPLMEALRELTAQKGRTELAEHEPPDLVRAKASLIDAEKNLREFRDRVASSTAFPKPDPKTTAARIAELEADVAAKRAAVEGGTETLTPAQERAKAAGWVRGPDGVWAPPKKP